MTPITSITAPAGMSGLVAEPWTPGEIYGVAANWSDAAATVYTYGDDGWQPSRCQVADFSHEPRSALAAELREALIHSGETPGNAEDEADDLADDALELPYA